MGWLGFGNPLLSIVEIDLTYLLEGILSPLKQIEDAVFGHSRPRPRKTPSGSLLRLRLRSWNTPLYRRDRFH